jgi:hypothetical protein
MKKNAAVLLLGFSCVSSPVFSASCEDYPYTDGINVESVAGGTKILATASTSVSFDDVDAIKSAREEAMLEAKAYISKFLSEGIKSDETISKAVEETKSMQGTTKSAERKEVKETLKKLQNSSQALLRGVVPLGDCYTKAREFRVSVGIKPDTINQAGNLSSDMNKSIAPASSSTVPSQENSSGTTGGNLQGVEGFNNASRLKNF